jgi:hypothetical protein
LKWWLGKKGKEREIEEVIMFKVHFVHVWKYHNEIHFFVQSVYINLNKSRGPRITRL